MTAGVVVEQSKVASARRRENVFGAFVRALMIYSLVVLREPNIKLRNFTVRAAQSITTQKPSGTVKLGPRKL